MFFIHVNHDHLCAFHCETLACRSPDARSTSSNHTNLVLKTYVPSVLVSNSRFRSYSTFRVCGSCRGLLVLGDSWYLLRPHDIPQWSVANEEPHLFYIAAATLFFPVYAQADTVTYTFDAPNFVVNSATPIVGSPNSGPAGFEAMLTAAPQAGSFVILDSGQPNRLITGQ